MPTYIALLRGINVGGKNKIKMAELKQMLEEMGFGGVQTYIQSGNVLFASDEAEEPLRGRLEEAIKARFGISASVMLRTAEEWGRIVERCPYDAEALAEGESIHLTLFNDAPTQERIDMVMGVESGKDEAWFDGRAVYMMLRQSILDSKLANSLGKLGVPGTARNWNTVMKLDAMAKAAAQ